MWAIVARLFAAAAAVLRSGSRDGERGWAAGRARRLRRLLLAPVLGRGRRRSGCFPSPPPPRQGKGGRAAAAPRAGRRGGWWGQAAAAAPGPGGRQHVLAGQRPREVTPHTHLRRRRSLPGTKAGCSWVGKGGGGFRPWARSGVARELQPLYRAVLEAQPFLASAGFADPSGVCLP